MSEPMVPFDFENAWTHPSVQRKSLVEMRERLAELRVDLARDSEAFADHPDQETVKELLADVAERIATFETAIAEREKALA